MRILRDSHKVLACECCTARDRRAVNCLVFLWAMLFPISLLAVQHRKSDEHVDTRYGFAIKRPDASWSFRVTSNRRGRGSKTLVVAQGASQVNVTVVAQPMGNINQAALQLRNETLLRISADARYTRIKTSNDRIAAQIAPGFELTVAGKGATYRVKQSYLVHQGLQYTVALTAPADDFKTHATEMQQIRDTLRLLPISKELQRENQLVALASKCGSELVWANSWKQAAGRAVKEQKLVMALIQMSAGFNLSDAFSAGPLMDQDVIKMIDTQFVALRYRPGMTAPFVSHKFYGISPTSLGNTVLLLKPDGTVVADTFCNETMSVREFLREHAVRNAATLAGPPTEASQLELIRWQAERGRIDAAQRLFDAARIPGEHFLKASLYRRQRKQSDAMRELALAEKTAGRQAKPRVLLDEGIVLMRAGKTVKAKQRFESVVKSHGTSTQAPQAAYWLGSCHLSEGNVEQARKTWLKLIDHRQDNRWCWKAASMMTSTAFRFGGGARLRWFTDAELAAFRSPALQRVPLDRAAAAAADARQFLVEHQRSDGSWVSPARFSQHGYAKSKIFTSAVTSICGLALLPHEEDAQIKSAIQRAAKFVQKYHRTRRSRQPQRFFMDYSPWSEMYMIRFLTAAARGKSVRMADVEKDVAELIQLLQSKQKKGGGWSYYLSTDIDKIDHPAQQSISFMTAPALVALIEARDAGFEVPAAMIQAATDCLSRMRNPDKTFEYFLWHEREGQRGGIPVEGVVGRGPLCALALSKAGRGSAAEIRSCLDLFLQHRVAYARETGKSLMHSGRGSQGSHYLLFDYAWCAEAIQNLPQPLPDKYRQAILEQVLAARSAEGSYLDNPINGWHYGTAMALQAFNQLLPKPQ